MPLQNVYTGKSLTAILKHFHRPQSGGTAPFLGLCDSLAPDLFPDEATTVLSDTQLCLVPALGHEKERPCEPFALEIFNDSNRICIVQT